MNLQKIAQLGRKAAADAVAAPERHVGPFEEWGLGKGNWWDKLGLKLGDHHRKVQARIKAHEAAAAKGVRPPGGFKWPIDIPDHFQHDPTAPDKGVWSDPTGFRSDGTPFPMKPKPPPPKLPPGPVG